MSPKGFAILAAATVASIALATASIMNRDVPVTATRVDQPLFSGLASSLNDVARIEVVAQGKTLTLKRHEGDWRLMEKGNYPADPDKVRELALALASARLVEAKTSQEDKLKRLELEDPNSEGAKSQLVRLENSDGKEVAAAVIGKTKYGVYGPGRAGVYVRRAEDTQSWLADIEVKVPADPLEWLKRDVVDVAPSDLQRVVLHADEGNPVVLARENEDSDALSLESVPEGREVDAEKIERVTDVTNRLTFQDVKPAAELAATGEPAKAAFQTKDGLELDFTVMKMNPTGDGKDPEYWVTVDASAILPTENGGDAGNSADLAAQSDSTNADASSDEGKPAGDSAVASDEKPLAQNVAEIEKRVDGWAYKLSTYLGERLTWTKDNFLKPADKTS